MNVLESVGTYSQTAQLLETFGYFQEIHSKLATVYLSALNVTFSEDLGNV